LKTKTKEGSFAALAALAATLSPSRVGTAAPGAGAPLAASPLGRGARAHATTARALRRSLRACTAEGVIAEVVGACAGGAVLTGWAMYVHASPAVLGLLLSVTQLAQLFQFPAAWTTSVLGRRRACILLVSLSRQAMLPLCALPFLPLSDTERQVVLLAVAGFSSVLGVLGNNAWVAWMGELVPQRIRGRYFGRRSALCTLGGALAAAAVGKLLDEARPLALEGSALAVLQLIASVCGAVTTLLLLRQHEPAAHDAPVALRWTRIAAPFRDPAVRGLCAYLLVWNFAVGLAGSFFTLHSLSNLNMSFTLIALHGTAVALVRMVAAPVWGRLIDRLGARPVLIACSFAIGAVPLVWLFPTPDRLWPLALDCVLAGTLWSGHALAAFDLPLSITPKRERPFYLAALAMVTGVSYSVATVTGGLLVEALPDQFTFGGASWCDLHVMFALSALLRLSAAFASLRVREPDAKGVPELYAAVSAKLAPRLGRVALHAKFRVAANDNAASTRAETDRSASAS
jgi:MFS family permease